MAGFLGGFFFGVTFFFLGVALAMINPLSSEISCR